MTDRCALALGLVLALAASPATASPYRWLDASGTATWSDRPPTDGAPLAASPNVRLVPSAAAVPASRAPAPESVLEGQRRIDSAAVPAMGALPAPAVAPVSGHVTVDELLEITGVAGQLPALAAQIVNELSAQYRFSSAEDAVAARVLTAAFDAERLRREIRTELPNVDPERVGAVVAWYRGPVGARATANAISLGTPAGRREFDEFAARVVADPPPAERRALVERLDWVEGDSEIAVDVLIAAVGGMARTVNAALPPERRQRPASLDRQFDHERPRLHAALQRSMLVSLLFIYRDASDEDIRARIAFAASPPSRWYFRAVRRALVRALGNGAERAGRELVRAIPFERWPGAAAPAAGR